MQHRCAICLVTWLLFSLIEDVSGWILPLKHTFGSLATRNSQLLSTLKNEQISVPISSKDDANTKTIWSDEEFQGWFHHQLVQEAGPVLHQAYGDELFLDLSKCVTKWRQRYRMGLAKEEEDVGGNVLWKRLFKRDRVVKEVIESIPIIHAMDHYVQSNDGNVTILDLCSGKGYLSMILSEYLPPNKVTKLVLIDKAWPMCHMEPKPHHMNWDHIYGNYTVTTPGAVDHNDATTTSQSYFTTWPIPLHTSKQNLKKGSDMRQLQKRLGKSEEPVFVLGVHLCGTLSLQAVQMFYSIPTIHGLILKPCCLPTMAYEKQQTHFQAGKYAFPTKEVCAPGFWKNKEWEGPPRWHLQGKFDAWCRHLYEGMKYVSLDVGVETKLLQAPVQTSGGFQNSFLFAQKEPTTERMWDAIGKSELKLEELKENPPLKRKSKKRLDLTSDIQDHSNSQFINTKSPASSTRHGE